MKAKVTSIGELQESKHASIFYYIFFKGEDGKAYKTCVYLACRNHKRWDNVKYFFNDNPDEEVWLDNLVVKKGSLVDADSFFTIEFRKEDNEIYESTGSN
jgi:hypothetical protein